MTIEDTQFVSVIIPTHQQNDSLLRALTAVCLQEFPAHRYEVIVADDAVSTETRKLVEAMAESSRCKVRYVPVLGKHGPAAARNCGWREARGEILAFTDDDCVADPLWLPLGVRALCRDSTLDAVWGKLISPGYERPQDDDADASHSTRAALITTNCFVRRRALALAGGFDEQFRLAWREDTDLYFRMLEQEMKVEHTPLAVVVRPAAPQPWGKSLVRQARRQFDVLLYRKHPRLYRQHIAPFPLLYVAIVGCAVGALIASLFGAADLGLLLAVLWVSFTLRFAYRRLGSHYEVKRMLETILTSIAIPWLAIYFRAVGWWRITWR